MSLNSAPKRRPIAGSITVQGKPTFIADDWADPFLVANKKLLDEAGDEPLRFELDTWDWDAKTPVGLDVEIFPNYFLVVVKRFSDGKRAAFELSDRWHYDRETLGKIIKGNPTVTFNGYHFDLPLIAMSMRNHSIRSLKATSERIINEGLRRYNLENEYNFKIPATDHVDLLETNPSVRQGLKMIYARLHGRYIVDLPFEHNTILTPRQMNIVMLYCANDIDATQKLYESLTEPLELRRRVGAQYHIDLRSKSDAQMGEAIIRARLKQIGCNVGEPKEYHSFHYTPPSFIKFKHEVLAGILEDISRATFEVDGTGHVNMPSCFENADFEIGETQYQTGIGGLHSNEEHRAIIVDDDHTLLDVDVGSFYPEIIRKLKLAPDSVGPKFTNIFGEMIDERLTAKHRMQEIEREIAVLEKQLKEIEGA